MSATVLENVSEVEQPLLEHGDRLTRPEFEQRYQRMAGLHKAELIEGIVYMPSPVRFQQHSRPHMKLSHWLNAYEEETPGVVAADNATVRLDFENEPQPDLVLMKLPEFGGQAHISKDDYIEGAPELMMEVAGSSRAYDLHQKKEAYRRNGVCEYLAWIVGEKRIVWFELVGGEYCEIAPDTDGLLKSRVFPGLWLDAAAMLRRDMKSVLAALRRGLDSAEHREFLAK